MKRGEVRRFEEGGALLHLLSGEYCGARGRGLRDLSVGFPGLYIYVS